jgi:hypothetical protein
VAQGVGPEFKPQYRKGEKNIQISIRISIKKENKEVQHMPA